MYRKFELVFTKHTFKRTFYRFILQFTKKLSRTFNRIGILVSSFDAIQNRAPIAVGIATLVKYDEASAFRKDSINQLIKCLNFAHTNISNTF